MVKGHTFGLKLDESNKLLILLFTIAACVALAFYVGFIMGEEIVYTHFFYIPIILAGVWYHKKAIYAALFLSIVHILVTHSSAQVVTVDNFARCAILIAVAYVIGLISEKRAKGEEELQETRNYLENLVNYANAPIIVWNPEKRITWLNRAFERLTGYTADEVMGQELSMLFSEASRDESLSRIERTLSGEYWESVEIPILRKDGDIRVALWNSANIYASDSKTLMATIAHGTDITERKRAEDQIKASLKEKEVLLREIHHRVKNNLQIISSLLKLQSRYIKDKQTLHVFKESQNRIRSMALIHEKLYQSRELARIDFVEYVRSLVANLFRSYEVNSDLITLKTNIDDVFLGIDTAIPCGLIIDELVSNSLKYAFTEGRQGEIHIDLHSNKESKFTLIVSDNGVGFPKDLDFRNTESLGLQLTCTLVDQLQGTIELDRSGGTEFKITFPEPKYKQGG